MAQSCARQIEEPKTLPPGAQVGRIGKRAAVGMKARFLARRTRRRNGHRPGKGQGHDRGNRSDDGGQRTGPWVSITWLRESMDLRVAARGRRVGRTSGSGRQSERPWQGLGGSQPRRIWPGFPACRPEERHPAAGTGALSGSAGPIAPEADVTPHRRPAGVVVGIATFNSFQRHGQDVMAAAALSNWATVVVSVPERGGNSGWTSGVKSP